MKYLFASMALLAVSYASFATPVDLGGAGSYTLLATGTPWYGSSLHGNMNLGSGAEIYGNVGARGPLMLSPAVTIHGDADYGDLIWNEQSASITGVRTQQETGWDNLYNDLKSASQKAKALGSGGLGLVDSSTVFHSQGNVSVFDISGLTLGEDGSLTLEGSATDQFIINIGSSGVSLDTGASINLDGVLAENVLFNMYTNAGLSAENSTLAGSFIAPDGYFQLGDGLDLSGGARFLGSGMTANLQQMPGFTSRPEPSSIPEPAALGMMCFGLVLLGGGLGWRKRQGRA